MVTTKMAEVLSARSEIGMLRRKCDTFEEECEKWKKKQQLLQKMCGDLNTVMRRYITDEQNKQKDRVTPIKITRSVGLQVRTRRKEVLLLFVLRFLVRNLATRRLLILSICFGARFAFQARQSECFPSQNNIFFNNLTPFGHRMIQ